MTVTAAASDASGITRVELLRSGRVVAGDTASPGTFTFDSSGLNGTHTLTLRATDRAGNTRTANRAFLSDNTAPTISRVRTSAKSPWTLKWNPGTRRGTNPLTLTVTDRAGNTKTCKSKIKT